MIKDSPVLTVRRKFRRPTDAQVQSFNKASTGFVVDSQDGNGALDYRIKPLVDDISSAFFGVAVTCQTGPSDNLAAHGALALAEPGDVLVVATGGYTGAAVIGDNMAHMAKNKGVLAIVTDGVLRDLPGLLGVGIPMYCRGISPNSPARNGPGTVGLPITLGGISVSSGDIVVGDRDGIVIVPQQNLNRVIDELKEVRQIESAMEAKVKGGLTVSDGIMELLNSDKVRNVD
ncbi:MAG: 4-hydroxy-4-methyl-2-oxoglutarate aldolase/4-carboxy-4-hydroxy-2-oxoadipate aldolase [Alphaproteobacteria bacterium MarineAlpha9_Bin7]|nr:MAG: 4-hydroxy-4-methyl-2-oxoglutarate aldolase/4-carboxy-4-hydroxy-2-oxoadipate aldolase [Alphaproteobacteria bacterium MarineAlpha9_Bin7]